MCFKFTTSDTQAQASDLCFVTPDCPVQAKACAARRRNWVAPADPAAPQAAPRETPPARPT